MFHVKHFFKKNPGLTISGGVHGFLLVALLISFAQSAKFDDAEETIPVETVTTSQFNQIMKGEKKATEVKPRPRAEKHAELSDIKPLPPIAEAKKDVPSPPPPPAKHVAEPSVTETPKPPEKPQEKPVEKAQQKSEVKPPEKPQDIVKKPPEKFKPDEVAKLLETVKEPDKKPPEPRKKPEKPAAKPLSGEETAESREKFDPSDISKFLSKEAPQREASKGAQLQQTASLGAPNASAAKMSPSMWGALDGLLQEQYKQCWSYLGLNAKKYVPEIHVQYSPDGKLIGQPALLNPPADPQLRGLADSALRAVKRCDPLKIPAQYQPFYDQWKGRVVRFDPEDML